MQGELARSLEHAVSVVNQSSTPMEKEIDGRKFVLHDNRIYVFSSTVGAEGRHATSMDSSHRGSLLSSQERSQSGRRTNFDIENPQDPHAGQRNYSNCSVEQTVILNILTTSRFRVYQAMYTLFRLLDSGALIVIIVVCIMAGTISKSFIQEHKNVREIALVSTVGVEIFYDVMLTTNKYWALQRLSIFIGLLLFVAYYAVVIGKFAAHDFEHLADFNLIIGVLTFRFVVFILEEMVDIGIDYCIHNAIIDAQQRAAVRRLSNDHARDAEGVDFPNNVRYEGSFFAWGKYSVYSWADDHPNPREDQLHAPQANTDPLLQDQEQGEDPNLKKYSWQYLAVFFFVPAALTAVLAFVVALMGVVAVVCVFFPFWCIVRFTGMSHYCREMLDEFKFLKPALDYVCSRRSD